MKELSEQLEELNLISDINKRVEVAYTKFSNGDFSAKAIRALWNELDNEMRIKLLHGLYAKEVRKDNARRLPPEIIGTERGVDVVYLETAGDIEVWGTLEKYQLLNNYEKSKTQDKFIKFKNVVDNYLKRSRVYIWYYTRNYLKHDISGVALDGFINELIQNDKVYDTESLNLPSSMTIGAELECVGGPNLEQLKALVRQLGEYGIDCLVGFKLKHDSSIKKNNIKRRRSCFTNYGRL